MLSRKRKYTQQETRPRLELVGLSLQLHQRREARPRQHLLAAAHLRLVQVEDVNDPQMDLPDGVAIIVDQADAALSIRRLEKDFLLNLAQHAGAIGIVEQPTVVGADVPADADRPQRSKTVFRRLLAARVVEQLVPPA